MENNSDQTGGCAKYRIYGWLNDPKQIYNLIRFDFEKCQSELKRKINRGETIYQRDINELREKRRSVGIMKVIVDSEHKLPNKL